MEPSGPPKGIAALRVLPAEFPPDVQIVRNRSTALAPLETAALVVSDDPGPKRLAQGARNQQAAAGKQSSAVQFEDAAENAYSTNQRSFQ